MGRNVGERILKISLIIVEILKVRGGGVDFFSISAKKIILNN